MIKAIKGFRNIMTLGDDEHNYPIMDPYEMEDVSFHHVDQSAGKKYSLSADTQALNIAIDLGTDQGYVMIEDVQIFRHNYNADIKVTGFMDLADTLASAFLDNILDQIVKQHANERLTKFARKLLEEAIDGMTAEEFFDLLDYFVKKNDEQ
ncbi:hypothetical protein U1Q18_050393 [Sarracenia purpurea var. burkii]